MYVLKHQKKIYIRKFNKYSLFGCMGGRWFILLSLFSLFFFWIVKIKIKRKWNILQNSTLGTGRNIERALFTEPHVNFYIIKCKWGLKLALYIKEVTLYLITGRWGDSVLSCPHAVDINPFYLWFSLCTSRFKPCAVFFFLFFWIYI